MSSIVLSISISIVFSTACYSYVLIFVRKEMNIITNKRNMYITRITMGSPKKKKNIWMDLVHNGGGSRAESTFHVCFFTFNVKIMSKNWKRMIKQW